MRSGPPRSGLALRRREAAVEWHEQQEEEQEGKEGVRTSSLSRPALLLRRPLRRPRRVPAASAPGRRHRLPSLLRAGSRSIRGERGCIFASPLSSEGKKHRAMHDLLEELANMHSSQHEAKMLLPRAVGVSLSRTGSIPLMSVP